MMMMAMMVIACVRPGAAIQREQEKQTERKQAGEVKTHYEQRHLSAHMPVLTCPPLRRSPPRWPKQKQTELCRRSES